MNFPSRAVTIGEFSVFVYIDNSNLFIETIKLGAKKQNFLKGITQDCRIRISVKKFLSLISRGRSITKTTVYGSETNDMKPLWDALRARDVTVELRNRSSWSKKEKRVDCAITADAMEHIYEAQAKGIKGTLIFVSGDGDLIEPMEKAMRRGWLVEVWALQSGLSDELNGLRDEYPTTMNIWILDADFDVFTYPTHKWTSSSIPKDRSLFLLLNSSELPDDPKLQDSFLSKVVKMSVEIFQIPMGAKVLKPFVYVSPKPTNVKAKAQGSGWTTVVAKGTKIPKSHTAVVLVCSIRPEPHPSELKQVFCSECDVEVNGPLGRQLKPRYDFKKDVYQKRPALKNRLGDICLEIQTYDEYAKTYAFVEEPEPEHTAVRAPVSTQTRGTVTSCPQPNITPPQMMQSQAQSKQELICKKNENIPDELVGKISDVVVAEVEDFFRGRGRNAKELTPGPESKELASCVIDKLKINFGYLGKWFVHVSPLCGRRPKNAQQLEEFWRTATRLIDFDMKKYPIKFVIWQK